MFFIFPILEGGVVFSSHPTMQTMLFFAVFMRARYSYHIMVAAVCVATFVIAHHLSPGHAPRLFEINIHFVAALALSILWAAYWHERLYRRQFDTIQALEAARDAAEQANQAKMRFLASRKPRPAAAHPFPRPECLDALRNQIRYPEQKEVVAEIELAVGAMQQDVPFAARPVEIGFRARQARTGVAFR